ncbi:MAG: C39 family peptidase, partial [Chloroflexota bacterium]|nr:C39 family peptidase [Chloroflexota bacterium]
RTTVRQSKSALKVAVRPSVSITSAPERRYLGDVPYDAQWLNNCGPVTTNMVLGYYGIQLSQGYTANKLRPSPRDVSVGAIEMVTFAQVEYGYGGEVGWGGNMRLLETLIANNVPVIALQPLDPDSDINHFRVVHGYDRSRGVVMVSDSYRGRNLEWSYEYFEDLWNRRGYSYSLIYPRNKTALVEAITEKYRADDDTRDREGLARTQQYVQDSPNDPWAWLQLGQTLYHRERYPESLRAWDRANELGLPEKALWYNVWPISLLNQTRQYEAARELAAGVIVNNPGSSEAYYERARANHALGETQVARDNLRLALDFAPYNPYFREAYSKYSGARWVDPR